MASQPSGTVTFMFTDIEASTRLLAELGQDRYSQALAEHCRLLRAASGRHLGYEVDYEGDAFIFAFQTASEAVAAAGEAQEALAAHAWPDGRELRVRMGIHTGEPMLAPPKYVGLDVHKAARIMASGHGGQVLVSAATAALTGTDGLLDLGEHRLKDIEEPLSILQLGEGSFPPLKTISNTNLPRPASSFLGREAELEEILARIEGGARLVTLTGPGGTGKTRLAIEAASSLVPSYKAGVFWIGLAALRDPSLVTETIAQTLGAQNGLAEHIGERELLLLLDNLEQLAEAAPELSFLVESCPNLTLLVTSRELLRVRGEVEYPVPPLTEAEAVALFCERAQVQASAEIAELCARLDSLPLAVELAAARLNVLSPRQILERLSQQLDLLRGGRGSDPRQQTLRATIEWSYGLLSEEEQGLLRRLSVFAGGCTLEAAEAVAGADLDTLQALVEKSLLRHMSERYWMLDTIRAFALEYLGTDDDADAAFRRHAEWFLALAEGSAHERYGAEQADWLGRLEREHDNLRAALTWAHDAGPVELPLRLTAATQPFWYKHGHIKEGRSWLERALSAPDPQPPELRARILQGAGVFARTHDDGKWAHELAEEGLELYRQLGDRHGMGILLRDLGIAAGRIGDFDAARRCYQESATAFRELGERRELANVIANIGDLAFKQGDLVGAAEHTREGLALQRELGAMFGVVGSLINLGFIALCDGRDEDARVALEESMLLAHELGSIDNLAYTFEGMAAVAAARRDWGRAGRLLGRASAILEATETELEAAEQAVHEQTLTALQTAEPESEVADLLVGGRLLNDEEAISLVLAMSPSAVRR